MTSEPSTRAVIQFNQLAPEIANNFSNIDGHVPSEVLYYRRDGRNKRPIVIDVLNIAHRAADDKRDSKYRSYAGVFAAVKYFINQGHAVFGFVPENFNETGPRDAPQTEVELLFALMRLRIIAKTNCRQLDRNITMSNYDDIYALKTASQIGAAIVSCDRYADFQDPATSEYHKDIDPLVFQRQLKPQFEDIPEYRSMAKQKQKKIRIFKPIVNAGAGVESKERARKCLFAVPTDSDYARVRDWQMTTHCQKHLINLLNRIEQDWLENLLPQTREITLRERRNGYQEYRRFENIPKYTTEPGGSNADLVVVYDSLGRDLIEEIKQTRRFSAWYDRGFVPQLTIPFELPIEYLDGQMTNMTPSEWHKLASSTDDNEDAEETPQTGVGGWPRCADQDDDNWVALSDLGDDDERSCTPTKPSTSQARSAQVPNIGALQIHAAPLPERYVPYAQDGEMDELLIKMSEREALVQQIKKLDGEIDDIKAIIKSRHDSMFGHNASSAASHHSAPSASNSVTLSQMASDMDSDNRSSGFGSIPRPINKELIAELFDAQKGRPMSSPPCQTSSVEPKFARVAAKRVGKPFNANN